MVYTIDELKQRIGPVAEKYALRAVYLFGSYARNEATEQSSTRRRTPLFVQSLQAEMVKIFQNLVQVRTSDLP